MASTSNSNAPDELPWSISVKTVGGGFEDVSEENVITDGGGEKHFTVTVSPDDGVTALHDKIEASTGLKASQQRLIYRGRLIGQKGSCEQAGDDSDKIKDIVGLSDGQTIHLVKKRESCDPESSNQGEPNTPSSSSSNGSDVMGGSGSSGGLLSALLGMSSLADDAEEESNVTRQPTGRQRLGLRSGRTERSPRHPHYRLSEEDLEVPDPGSMEPVRQGLMTLHTLLPHLAQNSDETSDLTDLNPLEANREWYRGQWIDCRDTVNQWLEATVVEIVNPEDVLPIHRRQSSARRNRRRRNADLANDQAVRADDMEGRRRLLLEVCAPGDAEELGDDLLGFRPRENNEGVQILLIHYNGWPHRWDEWIRSDSERIRTFRTRTRHPTNSSTVSPTPQSIFQESPRTHMLDGDEPDDRTALLPELGRVVGAVNDLLSEVIQEPTNESPSATQNVISEGDLPWIVRPTSATNDVDECLDETAVTPEDPCNVVVPTEDAEALSAQEVERSSEPVNPASNSPREEPPNRQLQLQNLATLLDRLGRTLTDAAPHVASLAASMADDTNEQLQPISEDTVEPSPAEETSAGDPYDPVHGWSNMFTRDQQRQDLPSGDTSPEEAQASTEPDYVDYVNGLVNTTRGEVRPPRTRRSTNDDVASLLGAYLTAASLGIPSTSDGDNDDNDDTPGLGRLLRERTGGSGGGGGGIDIHIHAVVTAPGVTPGGLGMATLGGVETPTATLGGAGGAARLFQSTRRSPASHASILRASRHHASSSNRQATASNADEDDGGLFAELYSETPSPVDPNGSPQAPEQRGRDVRRVDTTDLFSRHPAYDRRLENESIGDMLARANNQSSAEGVSSTRRRSRRSPSSSSPRGNGWFRMFRRRRSEDS